MTLRLNIANDAGADHFQSGTAGNLDRALHPRALKRAGTSRGNEDIVYGRRANSSGTPPLLCMCGRRSECERLRDQHGKYANPKR
jgi:hypothetical protein